MLKYHSSWFGLSQLSPENSHTHTLNSQDNWFPRRLSRLRSEDEVKSAVGLRCVYYYSECPYERVVYIDLFVYFCFYWNQSQEGGKLDRVQAAEEIRLVQLINTMQALTLKLVLMLTVLNR